MMHIKNELVNKCSEKEYSNSKLSYEADRSWNSWRGKIPHKKGEAAETVTVRQLMPSRMDAQRTSPTPVLHLSGTATI